MLGRLSAIVTAPRPAISSYCNCTQTYKFAPTVPHQSGNKMLSFEQSTDSDFPTVLLGGDLGRGRRGELGGSNWGVIEVTKRVERNIPGIPGHPFDHLPYLPTLGPVGFLLVHKIFFSFDTLSHEVILATYLDLVLLWTSSFASNQKMFLRFLIQFRTLLYFPLSSVRSFVLRHRRDISTFLDNLMV